MGKDRHTREQRSYNMSRIMSKNTKVELIVFQYLVRKKIYFQKHYARVQGKPDIALPRKKKAVFIDGDFWHGRYPELITNLPKLYWQNKILGNVARDVRNRLALEKKGWQMLRVWESEIINKSSQKEILERIEKFLTT